jgi:hypothetical protein
MPADPWWTIAESQIRAMLKRVHDGEHPDDVYAEFYANAEHRYPPGRSPVGEYTGLDAERIIGDQEQS